MCYSQEVDEAMHSQLPTWLTFHFCLQKQKQNDLHVGVTDNWQKPYQDTNCDDMENSEVQK